MYYLLTALSGIIFGVLITFLVMKLKFQKDSQKLTEELSVLRSKVQTQEDFRKLIQNDFVNLAMKTVNEQQADLRKQNGEILDEKMKPLNEKLKEFQAQVNDFHKSGEVNKTEIIKEIENLKNNSKQLSEDAIKLTNALTMSQNVKGSYGENLLDVILQSGGLKEGIHYIKQKSTISANTKDENMHSIKPDIIINLPKEKHLIIDSKMTLTSYLEYQENQNKETKTNFIREIKARIKDLSDKNYENAHNLTQPDFILLYMPVENSVNMIYSDNDFQEIIKLAYDSNIIIVGSASLLTVVRLVNQLWAIQSQFENSNKIAQAGANLYETFCVFCEGLQEIQRKFNDVSGLFSKTINRFSRNSAKNPSLFSQIEILKTEYKINSTKQIPQEFLSEENLLDKDFAQQQSVN
ncbi:DNA recombination protein RmuC [bacterium]|nr:DNA recombination protein RmuC [bacterium]